MKWGINMENSFVLNFIKSKDIREHLLKIGYNFTTAEKAFVIFHADHKTLNEKHEAYKLLIETEENTEILLQTAKSAIKENGYDYKVSLELREEFFDTRVYDDFTLPAGNYKTAVFTVGEGKGENWWCVIFPRVCVGACSGRLEDTVSNKSSDYAYNAKNYVIKFKTVEIFEKVKKYLFF